MVCLRLFACVVSLATPLFANAPHTRQNRDAIQETVPPPAYLTDVLTNYACHNATAGYNKTLQPGEYRSNGFFDCFRTFDQIQDFLTTLVAQNKDILAQVQVATSVRNISIYAYKLSTLNKSSNSAIYIQSMMHAREWVAGSSNLFALASFLDEIHEKKSPVATSLFDIYFVPIVNVDGYKDSWSQADNGEARYTRKNAHQVDLNRNFPSIAFNQDKEQFDSESYPGLKPLSEPESTGIAQFIKSNPMQSFLDIHTFSALVLYPFADTSTRANNSLLLQTLSSSVATALNHDMGDSIYIAEQAYDLYPCYGTFIDYAYRTYNKPAITIEIAGNDFVELTSNIRLHGEAIYAAQNAFANATSNLDL
ncbi:carboxypeptidase [Thraustotheca clavata]|uniref:Carboxypeptidase n=1 Tax=Thraustotheca clavata TaxID=74557 RepID=A0A0A7CME1_9STRA|nr:secreted protein [Thraustotheca clavata]OQR92729.1 carboxypeptidase [Thraustotheca clavata]